MDFDLPEGTAVLARTPHVLRALLAGLPPAWTQADEGPETWSPHVIVGHLVHGERTDWIPRARLILAQGADRRFAPFDRFAQLRDDAAPLDGLLDELARLRAENLATLAGWRLTSAELALEGEHPALGVVTLRQLLATWVTHDLAHLAQAARVMAKQYRDAVGPWRAYLSVLDRQAGRPVLYMVVERFRGGRPGAVYARFRDRGRLAPPGLHYVGSWVTEDGAACYQVMECADPALLDAWMAAWADLVEFTVTPVLTSAEAAARFTPP